MSDIDCMPKSDAKHDPVRAGSTASMELVTSLLYTAAGHASCIVLTCEHAPLQNMFWQS